MRVVTILLAVVTYVSICTGQQGNSRPSNNANDPTAGLRLGLLATQLGVAPVPGSSSVQGRPNSGGNSGQQGFIPNSGNSGQQSFPPNSGGGIFTQPGNFNPAGFPSSGASGNLIQGSSGNRGCFCHPGNQVCPPGSVSRRNARSESVVRIANRPSSECPGKQVCCDGGVNSPVVNQGPDPAGPIIQNNCGVRELRSQNNANQAEASFGEFPWMTVVLGTDNSYQGGGALLSSNWVLTAAHKVNNFVQQPQRLKIRVGDHNVRTAQDHQNFRHQESGVQQIILHPQFNINNLHNDVALLRLSRSINHQGLPHISPVCLPDQGQLFSSQRCWVSGWGESAFSNANTFSSVLKKVDIPIWDSFVCEQNLRNQPRLGDRFNLDKTSFLCAGGEQGKDACTGDGGAPLVCEGTGGRFAVVGLVAWGIGCAQHDVPGVYVNIANYGNFIRSTTGISQ